jgi:hypothetical protein
MKLDEFHYHEMIDRLAFFAETIDAQLAEHPAVEKEKRIKKNVDKAIELLYDAYQSASNIRDKKFIKIVNPINK